MVHPHDGRDYPISQVSNLAGQVPQRLLGPAPFPLDRLIAILGVLLEENDVDAQQVPLQFTIPGEYTDMEISRVQVYAAVSKQYLCILNIYLCLHVICDR